MEYDCACCGIRVVQVNADHVTKCKVGDRVYRLCGICSFVEGCNVADGKARLRELAESLASIDVE